MADPVIKPLVDRGLGPNLKQLQRYGDGSSNEGPGMAQARAMTGMVDASTAGGLAQSDTAARYAHLPAPMAGLIRRNLAGDPDPQGGRD